MSKVSSSKLKANLGKYIRAVRQGRTIVVTDRDVPVARLTPIADAASPSPNLELSRPAEEGAPPLGEIEVRAIPFKRTVSTEILRADRDRR